MNNPKRLAYFFCHLETLQVYIALICLLRLDWRMQRKEAIAYGTYACTNTFLPTAVAAVVLYYGGNLVLQGHMSAGALVSFMLYQQSLTSAFQVIPLSSPLPPTRHHAGLLYPPMR